MIRSDKLLRYGKDFPRIQSNLNGSINVVISERGIPCYMFFLDCPAPASPLLRLR